MTMQDWYVSDEADSLRSFFSETLASPKAVRPFATPAGPDVDFSQSPKPGRSVACAAPGMFSDVQGWLPYASASLFSFNGRCRDFTRLSAFRNFKDKVDAYIAANPERELDIINREAYSDLSGVVRTFGQRASRLDIIDIIDNTHSREMLKKYPTIKSLKQAFDFPTESGVTYTRHKQRLLRNLAISASKERVNDYRFRLHFEMTDRIDDGWYLIFDTLTVSPAYYSTVFKLGNMASRDYCRAVKRKVAAACYGSYRKAQASGDDYYKYFTVVERGSKTGRLHFHVLHFCKDLPDKWKIDPNGGAYGVRREIGYLKRLWPYGVSSPKAVRLTPNDAYGKLGWRWPAEKVNGSLSPLKYGNVAMLTNYMVKYVTKSLSTQKGQDPWRIRMTRNLGLKTLQTMMTQSPMLATEAITGELHSRLMALTTLRQLPVPSRRLLRLLGVKMLDWQAISLNPWDILPILPPVLNLLKPLLRTSMTVNTTSRKSAGRNFAGCTSLEVNAFSQVEERVNVWLHTQRVRYCESPSGKALRDLFARYFFQHPNNLKGVCYVYR